MRILDSRGDAWRNTETEELARAILKDIDPLLDIRWFDTPVRSSGGTEGRYAILCRWPQADRRWELYQRGEIGDCHDIIGWCVEPDEHGSIHDGNRLPLDPMAMMDRICEFLGKMDNTRHSWRDRMRSAMEANAKLRKSHIDMITEETMDEVDYHMKRILHEPIVNLNLGDNHPVAPESEK